MKNEIAVVLKFNQIKNYDDCIRTASLKSKIDSNRDFAMDLVSKSTLGRQSKIYVYDLTPDEENSDEKEYVLLHGQSKMYAYKSLNYLEFPAYITHFYYANDSAFNKLFENDYMSLSAYDKGKLLYNIVESKSYSGGDYKKS